jgi:RHS repeat-associated protein
VTVTRPQTRTFFQYSVYSPELQLLSKGDAIPSPELLEKDFTGTDIIWLGNLPVAQTFTDPAATRFTFSDHLGTPLLQTDLSGAVVWRVEYDPYGSLYAYRAGGSDADPQPLRLPGQEAEGNDQENSLPAYNIFRWYRAGWGRYSQADPIGLRGGIDLYVYSDDAPVGSDDPLGLASNRRTPPTPPPTDCPTICNRAYADSNLNFGGGGVVCLNGIKCPCSFDVPLDRGRQFARRGECPVLDEEVISHEIKHVPESFCPNRNLCRGKFPPPTAGNNLECQHRRESTLNLMRAINVDYVTPVCRQKIQAVIGDIQGWIVRNCR